ncbi:hypothetical protein F441_03895 [Phytophthora nicotianae CJ01A1]|uniref:Transposase putative helix-turn-helix domain-containing protein n=1 Tax=Phytophthora nicotianae CJ01A1 TaxID=1317063 RepID=W2XKF3_PHYNI|nr:hypothetical protein F441_03895 [Phytophthora nicotianae CJ01A1]
MKSSKRGRPPGEIVASRLTSLLLRSSKTMRTLPLDEVVTETDSEPDQECDRSLRTWVSVKQRLREAFGLLRALLFIHVEDDRVCFRLRGFLHFHHWSVSWLALLQSSGPQERSLPDLLQNLDALTPKDKREDLKRPELQNALSALLAFILCKNITEFRPLQAKLSNKRRRTMEGLFGEEYRQELSHGGHLQDLPGFRSCADQLKHDAKREAFFRRSIRAKETTAVAVRKNELTKERKERQQKKAWSKNDEQEYERALQEMKQENKSLLAEKKLMIRQTRKYRLFPTRSQKKTLKQYMGTCRWTYNQAVAYHRKTNEFNANRLRDLYVTKTSRKTPKYPEGMGPPPEWVYDTPKNLRFNTLRTFQTNVKSALSNVKNGNIKKFKIDFSSKKKSPSFTISQDGEQAKIREEKSVFYLSITNLKDIRVKMNAHVEISSEIDILNINGFWFQKFGRGTKAYLDAIRKRRDNAQSVMSKFKNKKKSKRWQYRAYVRAKRTFLSSTAKLKNCVKELHYQTCSYLVKHYDVILLPIFQSKDMVKKKSSARNHGFNKSILSLNHFQFLQLLQAKC